MNKLKIIEITEATHNKYGEGCAVVANEVNIIKIGERELISVVPYRNLHSKVFLFKKDSKELYEMISLANSEELWNADLDDYMYMKTRNSDTGQMEDWYFHDNVSHRMPFHTSSVTFNDKDFHPIEKQTWSFCSDKVRTPYGDLQVIGFREVNTERMVGVELVVQGCMNFNDIDELCETDGNLYIDRISLLRQPHNAWLWAYMLDENRNSLAVFCGYDDLDNGLSEYIETLNDLV